ncbi:MAG: hypothetical protein PHS04_17015 [Tissierellia bacterium]|nr:hypothetical protein [Tissierellia bacterium]
MIKKQVSGDILESPHKHIVFAVNTEGYNDSGFAGMVARYYPELANTGGNELGDVITLSGKYKNKVFHAIVCHSLAPNPGWSKAPETVIQCLNQLEIPNEEPIATVKIGGGPIGVMMGADAKAILAAMEQSEKTLVVYSR